MPCPSCGRFRDDLRRKNSAKDANCKVIDKISDRRISVVSNEAREQMRYLKKFLRLNLAGNFIRGH